MPLVTITMLNSVSLGDAGAVADGVHKAIVKAGFPKSDRFQRILRLSAEEFLFDPLHPDLTLPRTGRFVLIEILISAGRTIEFKEQLLTSIVDNLAEAPGLEPHDVMVVFTETSRENWAFASGIQTYVDLAST